MGEFFTYLAITGLVFWWSLILVPWRPCSTREQLEADDISVNGNAALDNITVLIPARNEGLLIKHTLQALAKQGTGLNIIVIDDQSQDDTGAFASLHDALIDDCTLAKQVKQAGFGTWIGLSHSARSHRGYSGLKPNWEMVVRTAYTQLRYSPFLLLMATLIMMLMFWVTPFAFLWIPASEGITISVLGWVAIYLCYVPTLIYYRRSTLWVLAIPVIGTLYLMMTWTSALRYWRGERACWKDRRYESNV
jgi:hypothetical protein